MSSNAFGTLSIWRSGRTAKPFVVALGSRLSPPETKERGRWRTRWRCGRRGRREKIANAESSFPSAKFIGAQERSFNISKSAARYWKCHLIENDLGLAAAGRSRINSLLTPSPKSLYFCFMTHLHGQALESINHANDMARCTRWFPVSPASLSTPSTPYHQPTTPAGTNPQEKCISASPLISLSLFLSKPILYAFSILLVVFVLVFYFSPSLDGRWCQGQKSPQRHYLDNLCSC